MFDTRNVPIEEFLAQIATDLDISDTDYQKAEGHYRVIGEWLGGEGSRLAVYNPTIYPQGSFLLGTVVKPVGEDEYDVDLVCQLDRVSEGLTPAELKKMVGDRLKLHSTYVGMIEEKNRCWRLNYAGEFHMDILPAIPDTTRGNNAILVPDKEHADWRSSNPKGFANWFAQQMIAQLTKLAEATGVNVEQIPVHAVKSPLQRAIQLLKRQRDIRFDGHEWADDKPISMIITTLAARIYQNESDIHSTLSNIINTLASHAPLLVQGGQIEEHIARMKIIEKSYEDRWYIPNPMNPKENFADKWHENGDRKAKAFFQWVEWLQTDLSQMTSRTNEESNGDTLKAVFGAAVVGRVISNLERTANSGQQVVSPPHIKIENPGKPWTPDAS